MALFTIITNDFILVHQCQFDILLPMEIIVKARLRIQSFTLNRMCDYYIKFEKLVV